MNILSKKESNINDTSKNCSKLLSAVSAFGTPRNEENPIAVIDCSVLGDTIIINSFEFMNIGDFKSLTEEFDGKVITEYRALGGLIPFNKSVGAIKFHNCYSKGLNDLLKKNIIVSEDFYDFVDSQISRVPKDILNFSGKSFTEITQDLGVNRFFFEALINIVNSETESI